MRWLPLILFLLHTAFVVALAVLVAADVAAGYQESVQLWAVAAVLDLPALPLLVLAESAARPVLEPKGDFVWWVVYPAVSHGLLGGLTWSLVGWGLARICRPRRSAEPAAAADRSAV